MVRNFCAGGAAINALSKTAGAELYVVDIGVAANTLEGIPEVREKVGRQATFIPRRIRNGTRNFVQGAALTEGEVVAALRVGIELAEEAADEEVTLIGLGEMGIGNTTSASAITAALTGLPPAQITGRGTGTDEVTFSRKVQTIERALSANEPFADDALDVLRKVGGLEIAGLCGLCLGAAAARIGIVSDGFIATAGAALAIRIAPAVAGYIFAAHLSPEPGHRTLLNLIGQGPILDLEMRLGEGTGAALVLNIIDAAVAAFNEMATFNAAGVSDKA
jgi:nicotinate-nucleotide--dimethylbenzimidazole phosphoribosyltransferase